jgi:hypothetical protein
MNDKMTDFHLCPEGQRLWEEWDNLKKELIILNDCLMDTVSTTIEANAAWTAYQDHRAACQECTKLTPHRKQL